MAATGSDTPSQGFLVCPLCGYDNPVPARFCRRCWARLDGVAPVSAEMAARLAKSRRSKLRRARLLRILPASLALLVTAAGLFCYLNSGVPRPPPSTNFSADSGPGEWAMWRHDPAHTGYAPQTAKPQGKVKWRFTTGEPLSSSPALAGGILYLATGDHRLLALDADSGQVKWEWNATGPLDSSPAVARGWLYVGLRDKRLVALDAADGSLQWEIKLGSPIFSSPTVADGVVYVTCLGDRLYAVDAASGQPRWAARTKSPMSSSSPAVSQGIVVVGSRSRGEPHLTGVWGGSVFFIDAMSGRIRTEYYANSLIESSPAIADGVVYIGSRDRRLYALDINARAWPLEWPILRIWAYAYLLGYAPYPPKPSGLIWHFHSDGEIKTSPAVAGGMVFFGTSSGTFYALDITGEERWHFDCGAALVSSPAVGNGAVYFGGADGRLIALDAASGDKLWDFTTGGKISSSPTLAHNMVFVTSEDGCLYALE